MDKQRKELLEAPMGKLFVKMAIPGMFGMLIIGLYNLVDSIFVGQLVAPEAISAIAMGYAVILVNQALFSLFATGAVSLFSRAMGAGDRKTMNALFGNVFWAVSFCALLLTFFTYNYSREILIFLGAGGETLEYGLKYFRVLSLGFVLAALGPALNFFIRGEGQMKNAMMIVAVGTIINIILDPIFISVLGMGIEGAAVATLIGQFLVVVGNFIHFKSRNSVITINRKSFKITWSLFPEMVKVGFSGMFQAIAIAIQLSILLFLSSRYSVSSNIVMSATFRVMSFFFVPLFGISYGLQPIIGANYGAGLYSRVREAFVYFAKVATVIAAIMWLFFQLFPGFILSWFITDPAIVASGTNWFRIFQSTFFIYGLLGVSIMFFIATGKAAKGAFITLGRQVLFFIPAAFTLPLFLGEMGIWLAYPFCDVAIIVCAVIFMSRELKKLSSMSDLAVPGRKRA